MNKRPFVLILGVVMILGSIGFLIWSFVSTQGYEKTTAIVTSVEFDPTVIDNDEGATENYKITIEYTVNGQKYTTDYNATEGAYSVGQQIELKYDPQNPNNTSRGEMSLPLLIGICAAIVVVGGIIIVKNIR